MLLTTEQQLRTDAAYYYRLPDQSGEDCARICQRGWVSHRLSSKNGVVGAYGAPPGGDG